jgi:hypothetical protein
LDGRNRNQFALVGPDKRCIDHVFRRYGDLCGQILVWETGDFSDLGRRRAQQHRRDAEAFGRWLAMARRPAWLSPATGLR